MLQDFRKELHDFPNPKVPMQKSVPVPFYNPTWGSLRQKSSSLPRSGTAAFESPPAAKTAGCCWCRTAAVHPAAKWRLPLSTAPSRRNVLQFRELPQNHCQTVRMGKVGLGITHMHQDRQTGALDHLVHGICPRIINGEILEIRMQLDTAKL